MPQSNYTLHRLDAGRYEVFAVASERFWRERRTLVTAFFQHLHDIGSVGFLATPVEAVCREAQHVLPGVACVAGMHYRFDGALSKERWRILLHFARRGFGLVYAGLDIRFVWPVSQLIGFTRHVSVDSAFEGSFGTSSQRLHFTPDLAVTLPTPNTLQLLESIVSLLRSRSLEGLPRYMQDRSLLRYNLMGPAEQDLLHDALLSALHNRSVAIRKFTLASGAAVESGVPSMEHNASLPQCTPAGARTATARWRRACAHAAVLRAADLPVLDASDMKRGTLLASAHLRVMLMGGPYRTSAGMITSARPCTSSCHWEPADVFALHCLTKAPQCLDLSQCRCLTHSQQWCAAHVPRGSRGLRMCHRDGHGYQLLAAYERRRRAWAGSSHGTINNGSMPV